jgi:hypothetical protein
VAATNTDANSATTLATTIAGASGAFSLDVAVTGGTSVLNIVAVSPSGATAHAQRTIVFDFVPGQLILDVSDPDGDDNGPGTYQYPTSDNFHAGAFDIERFQVYDAGSDVIFRLKTRDLTPTFGSPLGAQLVDVYVHVPGAAPTSTAASFAGRNYTIAPAFAWSRLIEVQGFGQRYIDANSTSEHARRREHLRERGLALHHVPRLEGVPWTPAPGWGPHGPCSPARTGSAPTRRAASSRRRKSSSSVCVRPGGTAPICGVDPNTVPKALDVITRRPASLSRPSSIPATSTGCACRRTTRSRSRRGAVTRHGPGFTYRNELIPVGARETPRLARSI